MLARLITVGLIILMINYSNWIVPVQAQGCRQVCDNAYPNNISFECPAGIGGTWEPLDPSYQCENNSTLSCKQIYSTADGTNTSIWSIQCGCQDGWTGQTCGMCTKDSVCTVNDTLIDCDKTPAPYKRKIIECYPRDKVVKNIFGEGTISYIYDVDKAEATILLWKRQAGQPIMSNCTMTGCSVVSQDNNIVFRCAAITCSCNPDPRLVNCSSVANSFLLNTVKGESTFTCENKENPVCTLNQVNIPLEVTLDCTAAECGKSLGIATITQADRITGIIVGGVVIPIGVGICLVTPFVVYIIRKKIKRPYNEVIKTAIEGCTLELKDVQYKVNVRSGKACQKKEETKKIILQSVNMKIYPGQICAVMGSSGSGKTTLLDIISHVGKRGVVTGSILMDGQPLPKYFKRIAGYVTQEECLLGTLTVQEQLIYSAQLRLPESVPYSQIKEIVANVIAELRLNHVKDTLIGDSSVRGLSGGERRRVLIATELVTYPKILLLDEPTSGLDSYNATVVMQILKDLAEKRNCSIVCSIHQPRSAIYQMFDTLVLLWNGYTVYYGSAIEAPQFFAQNGFKCPKYENPGDFMISILNEEPDEAITGLVSSYQQWNSHLAARKAELQVTKSAETDSSGSSSSSLPSDSSHNSTSSSSAEQDEDLPNKEVLVPVHKNSNVQLSDSITNNGSNIDSSVDIKKKKREKKESKQQYSSSWGNQFLVLAHRDAVNLWRNPALLRTHAIITVVVAVFIGVVFLNLKYDIAGFQNRLGLIFFSLLLFAFACLSAVDLFIGDRIIFKKERANGCYQTSAYYCASMFSDLLPLRMVFPLIYAIVVYWMAGFVGDAEHFLKFILVFLLFNMVSAAMFYVISVSVPSVTVGNIVSAAILLFLMLFSGFLLNFESIPVWLIWLRYLSFFSYAFEALTANELEGLQLELGVEGFGSVNISANVFLVAFNLNSSNYWRNVGILAGMAVVLNILAYILLRFVRKPKQ